MNEEPVQDPLKALEDIGKPDSRQQHFLATLEDTHDELSAMAIHAGVPIEVRQLFETAKNVSLYSWYVYRFHQVAELVAFSALEFALRIRAGIPANVERPPTLGVLLKRAQKEAWFPKDAFAERRKIWGLQHARDRKMHEALDAHRAEQRPDGPIEIQEPAAAEIAEATSSIDIVSTLVKMTPRLRNDLAHGSGRLAPNSRMTLSLVGETINELFPRSTSA